LDDSENIEEVGEDGLESGRLKEREKVELEEGRVLDLVEGEVG
jgi:hypothetical protein